MLDLDAVRDRIRSRYEAKSLAATGVWHKGYGLGQTTVRNFLDGLTQSLTLDTVQKLEEPLGVSAEWIIFGEQPQPPQLSEEQIGELVDAALSEMQPGSSFGEIQRAVASSLREQLERVLAGQVAPDREGVESAPDRSSQSLAPTN